MRSLKRRQKSQNDEIADDAMKSIRQIKRRADPQKKSVEFLPSGSTTLNLALSGTINGGWARGRVNNLVGDASSGKTLLALEASFNFLKHIKNIQSNIFPKVKKARVIYNNREGVMDFPMDKMWKGLNNQIEWMHSKYIENLGSHIIKTINKMKAGESILYIVDSWDAFKPIAQAKRLQKAVDNDTEIEGSYNKEKNIYSQDFFAEVCDLLENNAKDFTLIIISQTRDIIGATFGEKKRRAGGAALDFYTHLVPWIRHVGQLRKKKLKEDRVYGVECEVQLKRSKVSIPFNKSRFVIRFNMGLDDIESMFNYLKTHSIKQFKGIDIGEPKTLQPFIKEIERRDLEQKLRLKVGEVWEEINKAFDDEISCRKQKCL